MQYDEKKFVLITNKYRFQKTAIALGISLVFLFSFTGCEPFSYQTHSLDKNIIDENQTADINICSDNHIPAANYECTDEYHEFSGEAVVQWNRNQPDFADFEPFMSRGDSFEYYSELDALGRCGTCYARLGEELMPTQPREKIGHIKPSGWHTVKYEIIEDRYLFNRCHLIGFQLTGENDNPCNLITGTRYFNTEGMLPYENKVADYIRKTGNHVLYRVTPIYAHEDDLVASGVQMEAFSVEDQGAGICFNVFVYNIQPGICIDYATGESILDDSIQIINPNAGSETDYDYVLNTGSNKFHYGDCSGVSTMKEYNKEYFKGTREEAIELGFEPCGSCKP